MSIKTKIYETVASVHTSLFNPLSTSKFIQEGVLTPEEFVAAGDLLVLKCPSWSWQEGNSKQLQKGLPKEKQFLVTKNVSSRMRVSALEAKSNNVENQSVEMDDGEGGWVATHINEKQEKEEDIPEIPTETKNDSDDDAPEINLDDLSIKDSTQEDDDVATLTSNVIKTRTYDLSICYDQYHQTPRVWLFGYDENKNPLKPEEVLHDISQDHVNKTVTVAQHPHTNIPQAYIHPCKHAAVMKRMVEKMVESGKSPRVDQYLFIFLKFIHAAIPTIEYDYTIDFEIK